MKRTCIFILTVLSICGCQAGRPEVKISPDQAQTLNLKLSGGVAANTSGEIFLTTPSGVQKYTPGKNQLEILLNDTITDLQDVAVTPNGVLLALRPRTLCGVAAGYLSPIHSLPGNASALSCDREFAYILTRDGRGARLIRYHLTGANQGYVQPILATEDIPNALCAVRGGCLVASGGNLIKVTDPTPGEDRAQSRVASALLVAIQNPITSVVADQTRLIVYFSTADTTYAWIQGQIIPIFPAGNRLALAKNTLTICLNSQQNCQIIQIPNVSQHTQELIKKLSPTTLQQDEGA